MIRRLKLLAASAALLLCLVPVVSVGAATFPFSGACDAASGTAAQNSPACQADGSDPITGKDGALFKAGRILAVIAAIAAVIAIMIGGFMYVTAGGDANRAKSGRAMVISAVVGLVVIALASVVVSVFINVVG